MTERLYYTDSYTTEFDARVAAIDVADDMVRLRLDRTAFYPTSGGQMHDLGSLAEVGVVDVREAEGEIWHVLTRRPDCEVGDRVVGRIDAERRAHHRQQHTGQHVLSRVLERDYSLATESSRLGENGNTLDVRGTSLRIQDLDRLEESCDEVFRRALEVRTHFVDTQQAEQWGVRAKKERAGRIRVIEVDGVDRCACGGTHVRNTAEIAALACSHLEKVRGGQRIHFLCGARALRARRDSFRTLHDLATSLTTGADQLGDSIRRLKDELKSMQRHRQQLALALVKARAPGWREDAVSGEIGGTPVRWIHRDLDEDEALALGGALRALTSAPGTLVSLTTKTKQRGQLVLGRSAELDLDCRVLLAEILEPLQGSGGGQPEQARGGFSPERHAELTASLRRRITGG